MSGWEKVKRIFICRIILWILSAIVTGYWIVMSFVVYNNGNEDPTSYAKVFRPIFYKCLLITAILIGISFILRSISDKIKADLRKSERGF